jgi:aryl-alcohol dehydrogenase-like predicted oxidoreductase
MAQTVSIGRIADRLGSSWLGVHWPRKAASLRPLPRRFRPDEQITLGRTGIRTSLLAMGTGTRAKDGHSNQTGLGPEGLTALLLNGYERGLRFFDTADTYGSHRHIAEVLKRVPRETITILTKTRARDAVGVRADLERFRRELKTDYLDICLLHCVTEADWTGRYKSAMDVLSEAKEQGILRAHGSSCHGIEALRAAAVSPWVEIDLVRINPIGNRMDADPATVLEVIRQMRAAGKGIVGMKILGQGAMRRRVDEALHYALSIGVLDAFTVGAETIAEQEDLLRRIAALPCADTSRHP